VVFVLSVPPSSVVSPSIVRPLLANGVKDASDTILATLLLLTTSVVLSIASTYSSVLSVGSKSMVKFPLDSILRLPVKSKSPLSEP